MAEYIEREAAKKAFCEYCDWAEAGSEYCQSCPDPVGKIPAADVVPVRHGRWKKVIEDDKYYHMECSRCCGRPLRSRWVDDAELSTFCPWCGALMDKDGDGDV